MCACPVLNRISRLNVQLQFNVRKGQEVCSRWRRGSILILGCSGNYLPIGRYVHGERLIEVCLVLSRYVRDGLRVGGSFAPVLARPSNIHLWMYMLGEIMI